MVPAETDPLAEVREAAGAVIASLKWFIDAAEQAVADPESFDRVVSGGKSFIDAFAAGFVAGNDDP